MIEGKENMHFFFPSYNFLVIVTHILLGWHPLGILMLWMNLHLSHFFQFDILLEAQLGHRLYKNGIYPSLRPKDQNSNDIKIQFQFLVKNHLETVPASLASTFNLLVLLSL